ncbi:YetF domain-containing protein [Alteribacillus sp. JSM 102045]|uniref:YetF domain-containing protein n=1 Tax=Alteribacillus sp. JSM 102045 TaxID=1562101 RepID=UPI0035C0C045
MSLAELIVRITCSFLVLLLLTRIMGRKELRQLTFFNFVSGISIGSIGANLVINQNLSIRNGIIALVGWTIFTIVMGLLDINSKKVREVIEGQPIILIRNGKIMEKALQRVRLDLNALKALLRQKNAFAISEVEYAIFETDGNLSVMKKENKQTALREDINPSLTSATPAILPTEVISDGKLNRENITKLNLEENWVEEQVHQAGLASVSDVFYAELQKDGTLYVDEKNVQ